MYALRYSQLQMLYEYKNKCYTVERLPLMDVSTQLIQYEIDHYGRVLILQN